jgi:sugar/nucleoside kinase (ribokinase family)
MSSSITLGILRCMNQLDFVAIGDCTVDEFIKLQDVQVYCDINSDACTISMRWGDKIPYEKSVLVSGVGNAANAAVAAARLGLKSGLVSNVGKDRDGEEILATYDRENVDRTHVRVSENIPTNHHYVLWYNAERTILVKHYLYEYQMPDFVSPPKWLYLSSLAENSLPFQEEIASYVKASKIKLAFQPGTFQIKLGYEKLKHLYEASELFFCNKEEAERILETKESDIKNLLAMMHERGPQIVIITDGPEGAYVYDGSEMWMIPMYPDPAPPVDRTGAGDSFSSTFTAARALGHDIPTALSWGPINSMNVVQYIGAQEGLLSKEKIKEYLAKKPDYYVPSRLN